MSPRTEKKIYFNFKLYFIYVNFILLTTIESINGSLRLSFLNPSVIHSRNRGVMVWVVSHMASNLHRKLIET